MGLSRSGFRVGEVTSWGGAKSGRGGAGLPPQLLIFAPRVVKGACGLVYKLYLLCVLSVSLVSRSSR